MKLPRQAHELIEHTVALLLNRATETDDAHLARHLRECAVEIAALANEGNEDG
jgi:site-specific recombinase